MIPLNVEWVSQITTNVTRDDELLDLVARSGARILSIGFESLSEESLASVSKQFNRPSRFSEDLAKLRGRGIQAKEVFKVHEGRPHGIDLIVNGQIQLLINTPLGKHAQRDDYTLRQAATPSQHAHFRGTSIVDASRDQYNSTNGLRLNADLVG